MSSLRVALGVVALLLSLTVSESLGQGGQSPGIGLNRVEGRIVDENGSPVYNAYVELYSDLGSLINKSRSTGSGTFSFRGMGPGRYTVSVKPFGTTLQEESRDIEINNQNSRSDTVFVDFRLRQDKKRFQNPAPDIVGVVFAQDVPPDAKRLYTAGVSELQGDREKGLKDLEGAINLFPNYFEALRALGKAHILGGEFAKGYPYLLRALDVHTACPDCYYSLGLAFYKLDQIAAGIKAADAAALLSPESVTVHLLQGMLYFKNNDSVTAEKALKSANALAKGENPEVHWQLALVYNHTKRNEEAVKELEEYLKTKTDITAKEKENVRNLIQKMRNAKR